MNTKSLIVAFGSLCIFLSSCDEQTPQPVSIAIKDSSGMTIRGDTLTVGLNSAHSVVVEVFYNSGSPRYQRQINQEAAMELSAGDGFELLSHGVSAGRKFEIVQVNTLFADSLLQIGSFVAVSGGLVGDLSESVYFNVVD